MIFLLAKRDDNISHSQSYWLFKWNFFFLTHFGRFSQDTKYKRVFSVFRNVWILYLPSHSYCLLSPQCCWFQVSPLVHFNLIAQSWLTVTPQTAECWASLSISNSQSWLKLMSIQSVIPTTHLILCSPFSSCLQFFQHQGLFQWISSSHQVAKVLEFQLQISPSSEYSGLISFRMDWFDLLAVQGTLKSLLQHHRSKASILQG